MTIRTRWNTASFSNPFTPQSLEGVKPAGEYVILIDDELIKGPPIVASRRLARPFQTPAISTSRPKMKLVSISQKELDAALMKDRHQTVVIH